MTIPHMMNCAHDGNGWCLKCVQELHAEAEQSEFQHQRWRANCKQWEGIAGKFEAERDTLKETLCALRESIKAGDDKHAVELDALKAQRLTPEDREKLRTLADWFDVYDDKRGGTNREVQADLRRIAGEGGK